MTRGRLGVAAWVFALVVLLAGATEAVVRTDPVSHPPQVRRTRVGQVLESLATAPAASLSMPVVNAAVTDSGLVASGEDTTTLLTFRKGDAGSPYQEAGRLALTGSPLALEASGDRVVAACGWTGTAVVDVSSPSSPTIVAEIPSGSSARSVATQGDHVYVADWVSGMQIISLKSPTRPKVLGFADTPGHAYDVAVSGGRAYVADFDGGVRVFDVKDPRDPKSAGAWQMMPSATGIAVQEGYVYVADEQRGLFVVDVRRPDSPRVIAEIALEAAPVDVVVTPARAIVSDRAGGINLVDITDPAAPRALGRTQTASRAVGMDALGSRVWLATGELLYADTGVGR